VINFLKIKKVLYSKLKFKNRIISKIKLLGLKKELGAKLDIYKNLNLSEISQKIQEKKIYKKIVFDVYPNLKDRTQKIINVLVREEGSEFWSTLAPSQKWSSRLIITFVGVSSFGIIWSFFTMIDDTVQVQGKLEPKGTTIEVKVPLGGVIKRIIVDEGDIVQNEELLLELDTTAVRSKLKALNVIKSQIEADILLSKIQLGEDIETNQLTPNQKIKLKSLQNEYKSRINASKNSVEQAEYRKNANIEQVKTLEEVLEIREAVLNNLEYLTEIGGLSKIKYLKEKQEILELRGRLIDKQNQLKGSISVLKEADNKLSNTIAATKIDASNKIEENEKQLAQIKNQINEQNLTLSYQEIKSPLNGIVFDLQPAAPGYVVNTNIPILKLVPIDDLVARVFVSNRDIAFLKKEQSVKIRVDAYPYNEFGEIEGKIDAIGSDVLEPDSNYNFYRFPVTIKLKEPFIMHKKKKLNLKTGMSLSANIVLRKRPVLSLFTERILPFWSGLEQL
tara:strand:- start:3399 stop:4913 length:1515 start_codon:yes stop_codon:yes gene_type:complete